MALAFMRLLRPQWQGLHAVARRYCARSADARDLVQETLLRAWRGFSPTVERSYQRAWLYTIMRNVAIDWHRSASRQVPLAPAEDEELTARAGPDGQEPLPSFPVMDEDRFRDLLDEHLARAVDALEPAFREVVVLSVTADLNYREMAAVLDCPVGTVMSRMARARRALRERLADWARARTLEQEGRR